MDQDRNNSNESPYFRVAGEREAGVKCARCNKEIEQGELTASCMKCGGLHHQTCWTDYLNCGSYQCSQGTMTDTSSTALVISRDDLNHAEPLPVIPSYTDNALAISEKPKQLWNKLAIWAFFISLLGIPLFGIVTGLIAMILACIALVSHPTHKKGFGLAVAGLMIGFFEIIGWSAGIYFYSDTPHTNSIAFSEYAFDPSSLDNLPSHLKRAMKSNVLIEVNNGLFGHGMGSGVILSTVDGKSFIVTNRHVIDPDYNGSSQGVPADFDKTDRVTVQTIGQIPVPGKIEWIAPHGIDLALVSAPLNKKSVSEAFWNQDNTPLIGSKVFAIGNPHALGWTHSNGNLSQYRKQTKGAFTYQIIQTTTPLNPGNSGGGLYDENGLLIGINTMTGDKRVAEGLGFAIAFNTLLDLIPGTFQIPVQQGKIEGDAANESKTKN
ncbi:trypsin-like peptidase domain-containing protein [uncultured Gimesia sp.]|uniref:trypsin-like peptidase domain-containing protein n=1 Tax=uncultured Gimesia sp. TaxID=1678688 RepID=UPI0030DDBCAE|tara:strand:- start:26826 stop:28133 length:1308 start_codon:yes stop_codon:yes gene_type:complete